MAKIINAPATEADHKKYGGIFDPAYIELRRYVRPSGLESDLRGLNPGEFHVNTTELVQMLEAGHHGVKLDADAWTRLTTWIDLNTPDHGTWRETIGCERVDPYSERRRELASLYAGYVKPDPEAIPVMPRQVVEPIIPKVMQPVVHTVRAPQWPFDAEEARRRQGPGATRKVDLGGGVQLDLALVPAGEFVMGDAKGQDNERPLTAVKIERPFWMGTYEVTNEQYAQFDPSHDSRYEHKGSWKFNEWDLGWPLNGPKQPVIRVSQQEALAFCRWMSQKTGLKVTLPTEAQWEYASRAGSDTPMNYGGLDKDFSKYANLADYTIRDLVYDVRDQYPPDLVPREAAFKDGKLVTADVGSYQPNAWGLFDTHGNAWEWTRTALRPYPYNERDGRNEPAVGESVVARGGSWYDRPTRSRSAFRLSYPQWQRVYNVGLRVVVEDSGAGRSVASRKVR